LEIKKLSGKPIHDSGDVESKPEEIERGHIEMP
jgi:hypothetical protein